MKYYITADTHGFYTEFHKALDEAGYFTDPGPYKLIILGDIFDRGQEAVRAVGLNQIAAIKPDMFFRRLGDVKSA